jgi:sensor domain CHASE-containing protein
MNKLLSWNTLIVVVLFLFLYSYIIISTAPLKQDLDALKQENIELKHEIELISNRLYNSRDSIIVNVSYNEFNVVSKLPKK